MSAVPCPERWRLVFVEAGALAHLSRLQPLREGTRKQFQLNALKRQ